MVLRYRVSLTNIKGFTRLYKVKSTMSMYDFHKLLRDELDFPHDQLILFKGLDDGGFLQARYGMFDLGAGAVDEVTLGDTLKRGITSFTYFYNVTERKSVNLAYEGEDADDPGTSCPVLIESKGPEPAAFENGYVAYEDLPDEQKNLPEESSQSKWSKGTSPLAGIFGEDLDDLLSGGDEGDGERQEEDVIYDGSEDLTL